MFDFQTEHWKDMKLQHEDTYNKCKVYELLVTTSIERFVERAVKCKTIFSFIQPFFHNWVKHYSTTMMADDGLKGAHLLRASRECSDRGLIHGAKWLVKLVADCDLSSGLPSRLSRCAKWVALNSHPRSWTVPSRRRLSCTISERLSSMRKSLIGRPSSSNRVGVKRQSSFNAMRRTW